MRRTLLVTAVATAALSVTMWPAQAKGLEEHARVVVRGPGLVDPIRLSGEEAFVFVARSGADQAKWDVPNLGGELTPDADLGTAYRAVVTLRCGNGKAGHVPPDVVPRGARRAPGPHSAGGHAVLRERGDARVLAGCGRAPHAAREQGIAVETR